MKTKDFIKMLQDADPSGEAHVRMEGGIPIYAELKAGYWDGPYSYIDEDGNYVYSSKDSKVDIWCQDIETFVDHHFDYHDPNNWEYIKSKFKFELTYSIPEHRKEREDGILKIAKENWDRQYEWAKKMYEEQKKISLERALSGWSWFQNKLVDDETLKPNLHHYYTWKIYNEGGKEEGSNVYNTEAVIYSGMFEKLDNNKMPGYYQWILKQ